MCVPKRRTLWLVVALLLAVGGIGWSLVPRSRITQANYNRIERGMTEEDVKAILGEGERPWAESIGTIEVHVWDSGTTYIAIDFEGGKVLDKVIHFRTVWQTLIWYAKEGAAKIGVKWE